MHSLDGFSDTKRAASTAGPRLVTGSKPQQSVADNVKEPNSSDVLKMRLLFLVRDKNTV